MGYEHVLLGLAVTRYDYKNNLWQQLNQLYPSLYADTGEYVNFAPADVTVCRPGRRLSGSRSLADRVVRLPLCVRMPSVAWSVDLARYRWDYASRNYQKGPVLGPPDKQEAFRLVLPEGRGGERGGGGGGGAWEDQFRQRTKAVMGGG